MGRATEAEVKDRSDISTLALVFLLGLAMAACSSKQPAISAAARPAVAASEQNLPTGMTITPMAVSGATSYPLNPHLEQFPSFVAGQPVTLALSPDGTKLLVLTSGYNRNNSPDGRRVKDASDEYVFVFDVSAQRPRREAALRIPDTFDGIAWNPNGTAFYVSGGKDDNLHVFEQKSGQWEESGSPIPLGHRRGLGIKIKPMAAGVAVTADGRRALVADFENDSVSLAELTNRRKAGELDLRPGREHARERGVAGGEFPFWVVIHGNDRAYISSPRDRQIVEVELSGKLRVLRRISVPGQPNRMILNREGSRLYAALGSTDQLAVVDTVTNRVIEKIGTTAPASIFPNPKDLEGSNPNSLALSPDERTLYVTNGGANSIAVISLPKTPGDSAKIAGLIPTAWYPDSVAVSHDGKMLYVVNSRSIPGPNPKNCRTDAGTTRASQVACRSANQYILQLSKGGLWAIPVPDAASLPSLTARVAVNDHYRPSARRAAAEKVMAFLRQHIHHVIYIIKENRTYDQVLGDLPVGNGDPHLTLFPRPITPNHHQIASDFVDLDNFYASGEVSGDGWNWSTAARASDSVENDVPIQYAGRGLSYDWEGSNRGINVGFATLAERRDANPDTPDDPNLLPGTADVDAPDGPGGEAGTGYLWNAAIRAHLSLRNYGFFLDDSRYWLKKSNPAYLPPTHDPFATKKRVAYADNPSLLPVTDPYFRGFDQRLPDYWRFQEWNREFQGYVKHHDLPALELVRISHDHFGNFDAALDGVNTPTLEIADDDYALGLLVQTVAHSPYKDDTLIFVIEDDAQDGPDHVDAHRTVALVAGPYVKEAAVVSSHYTTVNMLSTIEDVLGMGPMGINDDVLSPMADIFTTTAKPWTYTALVPPVLRTTKLPLPPPTPAEKVIALEFPAYSRPRHSAAYWAEKTVGFDFQVEDHLNTPLFNRILWHGLKGAGSAYPTARSGRNLSRDRKRLLTRFGFVGWPQAAAPGSR